ncbi:MFS transporter [Streptomyces sp. NPDC058067]|uniref:MFS transporter n=1 Tax=Streptomyces sp. NPDC058067 TaxID=3346324 RepID=UPI0036E91EDE
MTATTNPPPASGRPPLVTTPLLLRFVSIIGASTSLFLLLSVVPIYADSAGGGGSSAGLATGALMLTTVIGELAAPRLVSRFGYRVALAAGLFLLGAPALVLTLSGSMVWIVAVCLVRGLGFAVTIVAGGALTVSLIPPERRGEGLALVGIVSGVPSLVGLPLGVWLVDQVGYTPICVAGGLIALASIAAVPGLPDREPGVGHAVGVAAGLRTAALMRPVAVFTATALGAGIVVTFLPLAVPAASAEVVTAALFVQSAAAMAARWAAGRHGDRHDPSGLVLPGLLVSAAGMLLTAFTASPAAVLSGVALFGIGFGLMQNATLTLMYGRVPSAGHATVTALWNFAYDAGMGAGALAFGALAPHTGYPWAFALTAAVMLTASVPAWRDRTRPVPPTPARPIPARD